MNIYVSNLSFNVQDEELKNFFTQYGEVSSAKIIMDRETNRSRGFGFVEMPDDEASKKAIAGLDGTTVDGREMKVSEARKKEDKPAYRDGGNKGYSPKSYNNSNSYNKNHY